MPPGTRAMLAVAGLSMLLVSPTFVFARRPPASTASTVTLWLRGLSRGTEEAIMSVAGERTDLVTRTSSSAGLAIALDATFIITAGAPNTLRVSGNAPAFLAATEADRPAAPVVGAFPIQAPFPVHVTAALVRHSLETGRRRFTTLLNREAVVEACPPSATPLPDASCHLVSGLTWGVVLVWLDAERQLAAAVIPTPLGLVTATTHKTSSARDTLLAHFARVTAARLRDRVGPPAAETTLVFSNVRIIDPAIARVQTGTVVVRDGTIISIDAPGGTSFPEGARIIDGRGLSLLPGLWDMHGHLKQADWGPAYLAAGVTNVRDLGNDTSFILALREEERSQGFPSPRLWLAAFIDAAAPTPYTSVQANTADQGRRLVREFAGLGFDQIKLWANVPRGVLRPIVDEAHARGLQVTRHAPSGAEALASIDAGVDHIDHLFALMEAAEGDLNTPAGRSLLAKLRANDVVVDPTLVVTEFANRSTALPLSAIEPGALKAPPPVVLAWSLGLPPERASADPLRRASRFVGQLHAAGATIVAGSDQGVPGYTFLREIELLVGAGLTPMEALAASTWIPARVMGAGGTAGRIAPGYRADLVIVEGNPVESITDLRRVRYVLRGGRLFQPAALWRAVEFDS